MDTVGLREALYNASMHVESVLWLGGMYPNGLSREFIDFIEFAEPEELIDLFEYGEDSVLQECLEENEFELVAELLVEKKSGFVLICKSAVPLDITFSPEGKTTSWGEGCVYWITKTYGETLEEAVKKAFRIREKRFEQEVKRQWEAKNATN